MKCPLRKEVFGLRYARPAMHQQVLCSFLVLFGVSLAARGGEIAVPSAPLHRISGSIRNDKGEAVPGVVLTLVTERMKADPLFSFAFTESGPIYGAEEGFERLLAGSGKATLTVRAQGYLPKQVAFEVPEEGDVDNLEVVLQAAPATLVGQVTGPDGETLVDIGIGVRLKEDPGWPSPGPVFEPRTDNSGRYRAVGLTEGVWSVYIFRSGYLGVNKELMVHSGENRLDIRLERDLDHAE